MNPTAILFVVKYVWKELLRKEVKKLVDKTDSPIDDMVFSLFDGLLGK